MLVATQSLLLTMNLTSEQTGRRDAVKDLKTNSLHAYFALVFLQHTSFSFWEVMERWSEERKAG